MEALNAYEPDLAVVYRHLQEQNALVVDFQAKGKISEFQHPKITPPRLNDKIKGAIFGAAVGDALGRILEDIEPNPELIWLTRYQAKSGDKPGPLGKITDDIQFMKWVSDSLVQHNGLFPYHLADEFTSRYVRDISASAQQFTDNFLKEELPWYECGVETAGNGCVIRSVPVGIFYREHASVLKLGAGIMASLTHRDPMAICSGMVSAYAIARLLYLNPSDLHHLDQKLAFLQELADLVQGIEDGKGYKDAKSGQPSNLYQRFSQDLPDLLKKETPIADISKMFGTDAYVLESLPFIVYTFLFTTDEHVEETIIHAVNLSKDSDTIGALAGAFSGALHGFSDINPYFVDNIEFRDKLETISQQLTDSPWKGN